MGKNDTKGASAQDKQQAASTDPAANAGAASTATSNAGSGEGAGDQQQPATKAGDDSGQSLQQAAAVGAEGAGSDAASAQAAGADDTAVVLTGIAETMFTPVTLFGELAAAQQAALDAGDRVGHAVLHNIEVQLSELRMRLPANHDDLCAEAADFVSKLKAALT